MNVISDGTQWRRALALSTGHDFYHTWDYHRLAAPNGAQPVLFEFEGSSATIRLPLLLSEGSIAGSQFVDAGSVYGYAGPVTTGTPDSADIDRFGAELGAVLRELGVVSVFSRLHPLLDNASLVAGCGRQVVAGKTVSIDLTESSDEQWRQYRQNHRRDINKLRRTGVSCERSTDPDDLAAFAGMYTETMKRNEAAAGYFFPVSYFEGLLAARDFDCELFICRDGPVSLCGGLFCISNGIVQYHLGGTDPDHVGAAPTKFMFDEVRRWAGAAGHRVFHLGGGLGGNDDSLFRFKKGFSARTHDFTVWNWVLDEQRYQHLVALRRSAEREGQDAARGYFPAYRAPG